MEKKDTLAKVLVVIGTLAVWLPLIAPVLFGLISLSMDGIFRFDYLLPAELGILVFAGGILLLWASNSRRPRRRIIAWGMGIAAASIGLMFVLGDIDPDSWQWAVAIGLLVLYSLGTLVMGVGGALLWSELFKK